MFGLLLVIGGAIVFGPKIVRAARDAYDRKRLPQDCPSSQSGLGTCPPNTISPNPTGGDPIAGMATALDYQWCHTVRKTNGKVDTAGSIAERVTGDRRRYLELVAANPHKGFATVQGASGPEVNFREPPCAMEKLKLPKSWNPWIDQQGTPRGKTTPYPPFDVLPPYPAAVEMRPGLLPTAEKGWG